MPHLDVLVLLVPALQGGVDVVLHLHVQLLQQWVTKSDGFLTMGAA